MSSLRQNDLCNGDCVNHVRTRRCGDNVGESGDAYNCIVCHEYVSHHCAKVPKGVKTPRRHPMCVPPLDAPVVDVDATSVVMQNPFCDGFCAKIPGGFIICGDPSAKDVNMCSICGKAVGEECEMTTSVHMKSRHPHCHEPPLVDVLESLTNNEYEDRKQRYMRANRKYDAVMAVCRRNLTSAAKDKKRICTIANIPRAVYNDLCNEDKLTATNVHDVNGTHVTATFTWA